MDDPKKLLRILILLTVLSAVAAALLYMRSKKPEPIEARPAAPTATFMLPDDYVFRQDDSRWGQFTIGETTDTMRAYGCTLSSVAMAVSNLTDETVTPGELVTRLNTLDGFTDRGWLI